VIARQFRHNIASAGTEMAAGRLQVSILIAMVAGTVWLARIYRISVGGYYHAFQDTSALGGQWFSLTGQISAFGLLLPIILWLLTVKDKRWLPWAVLFTGLELFWILPTGSRGNMRTMVVALVMVTWWYRHHIPWKTLTVLFMIALILVPIIGQYRYTIRQFVSYDQIDLSSTLQAYQQAQRQFTAEAEGDMFVHVDSTLTRVYDGSFLVYILENFEDHYDFLRGQTYYTRLPFVLVPYFLYQDRPIMPVHLNNWFPHLISVGSVPATLLGEAYMNFGFIGLCIIPFFVGGVLAGWDKWFYTRSDDVLFVAVYILCAAKLGILTVGANLASTLGTLRNYVLLVLVLWLARHFLIKVLHQYRQKMN
jgi:hypothetical protein